MTTDSVQKTTIGEATEALNTSRRTFLKNAGKVVVYTPPAMLALTSPSFRAIAQSSGAGDQSPNGRGNGRDDDESPSGGGGFGSWLSEFLRRLLGRG